MATDSPGETTAARFAAEEAIARRLADRLAEIFDAEETAVAAFEVSAGSWCVEVHFERRPDQAAVRALIGTVAGPAAAQALTFTAVSAKDWVAASLAGLEPVPAGRFLVHGAHDRATVSPQRIGIEIEAALAFGTGHHGTTRGCLLALDRLLKRCKATRRPSSGPRRQRPANLGSGAEILDVGTGTGVLAIAAARAMRCRVRASDIDRAAVAVARENARVNRAAGLIDLVVAAGLGAGRISAGTSYRLVFANILLPPLQRMAAPMTRLVAPGGHVILSGLLESQAAAAIAAYRAQGLALQARLSLEGWTTLVLARGRAGQKRRPGRSRPRRSS